MHLLPGLPRSRRAVLGLGLLGALGGLTACSLRLDVPPDVPTPAALDALRNDVARMLAATEAPTGGGDPADLDALRAAAGPEWAPPSELVTPTSSPTPESYGFADGLSAVTELVLDRLPEVIGGPAGQADSAGGRGLAALVDIAVGAVLALAPADSERAAALGRRLAALPENAPDPAGPGAGAAAPSGSADAEDPEPDDGGPEPDGDPSATPAAPGLEGFVRACYQAAYGYERLAVLHDAEDAYGEFARARITRLDDAAIQGNELRETAGLAAVGNEPAWQLDPAPVDAESALRTATAVEDLVAAAALGLFETPGAEYLGTAQLWMSADARARAGQRQLLRYRITDASTASPAAGGGA
ncbi:hypothetical protein [Brevibacterium pityocampae]|uniref:DUF4439 domain-containing protein n=1 Tax=Brevibacterium pityocampae TaxID=506594 RepID=A0ABP8JSZ3_9MICO